MASLNDRLKTERLRKARDTRDTLRKGMIPLVAYYGRDKKAEKARTAFYNDMAAAFSWPKRVLDPAPIADKKPLDTTPGMGGRGAQMVVLDADLGLEVNANSAPLEWLMINGHLETKDDLPGIGAIRLMAGLRMRSLFIGAERSGLRSVDFGSAGGGGGKAPTIVSDSMIDCSKAIERYRSAIPESTFKVIEAVAYLDVWLWEKRTAARAAVIMRKLHHGLDIIAQMSALLMPADFDARWNPKEPSRAKVYSPPPAIDQQP